MSKLVVKKTAIIINDYHLGDCHRLEKNFMIYDPVYHIDRFVGIYYDEANKRLYIPRGVDVYYIQQLLGVEAEFDDTVDPSDNIGQVNIKYLPRDKRQIETLEFMVGRTVNYKNNRYRSQLSVNIPTGSGKTYCSVATFSYFQQRSAIITSSINWLEQWRKCILEYTDLKNSEIYLVKGTGSIHRILQKDVSQYKIFLISLATIRSFGENNGWDKVTELFKHLRIGIKFYDEAHLSFGCMSMLDFFTSTKKTYYVTASPIRSDKDENRIFQLYFKNIPSINLFNEEVDPHTKYIAIKFNSSPRPQDISRCRNKYGLDRNKYTNYVVHQENFIKLLHIIMNILMNRDGKHLIYIGTQYAIDTVFDWLCKNYPEISNDIGIFTSKTTGDKMGQLNKRFILSTTKSCGAAVDIKGLKTTVVLAEPFKSEVTTIQSFGRTRDKDTLYLEVVDIGFKAIGRYYYEKRPIINKYATDTSEIKIDQDELDSRAVKIIKSREPAEPFYYNPIRFSNFVYRYEVITFSETPKMIEPITFV